MRIHTSVRLTFSCVWHCSRASKSFYVRLLCAGESSAELLQLDARIASFTKLHEAEQKAVKVRTEEKRVEVLRERAKHLFLQVRLLINFNLFYDSRV